MRCHPERSICYREAKANALSKDPLPLCTITSPARSFHEGPASLSALHSPNGHDWSDGFWSGILGGAALPALRSGFP